MKKIMGVFMILSAVAFANSQANSVELTIPVTLQVVDGVALNRSGDIDFGDVIIDAGEEVSDPVTITARKPAGATDTTVTISAPKYVTLDSGDESITSYTNFTGDVRDEGDTVSVELTFGAGNEVSVDLKSKLNLTGYETVAEYTGRITLTATTI